MYISRYSKMYGISNPNSIAEDEGFNDVTVNDVRNKLLPVVFNLFVIIIVSSILYYC